MRKIALLMVLVCTMALQLWAQNRTVTGKVTDSKGQPIDAATVLVKGTTVGTTSNAKGDFSISVPPGAKVLVISSVNYKTEEIAIGNRSVINSALVSNDPSLDEVVVTGYQTVRRQNITSAVSKIAGEAIVDKPVLSFDQALTGKAAGVQINTSSGLVGDNVVIRVRGASSISSGSQPLIVMDGIPLAQGNRGQLYNPANALADINPADIESVEVLKDAAAAAIYGSRGAAGVILITTKSGKLGTSKIDYDMFIGYNETSRKLQVLNSEEYIPTINKMRSNAGLTNIAAYGDINGDGQPDVVSTDWQDNVYRNGLVQNHQIAAQGGSAKASYYASINFNNNDNYIINNGQRRVGARINAKAKAADWLTIGINSAFTRTTLYGLGSGTGGAASGVPLGPLLYFPNVPVFGPNGDFYLGQGGNGTNMGIIPNPVAVLQANYDRRDTRRFLGSAFAEAQIVKGLKFKTQYNVDLQTAYTDQYWNPTVGDGGGLAGVAQTVYDELKVWNWFNTLNYQTKIGANHDFNILLGAEYNRTEGSWNYASGIGQVDPTFSFISPANYTTVSASKGGIDGNNTGLASYFGTFNYNYKGKYFAQFSYRGDSYSGYGKDNRWGYFPAASVAWRVSEENFLNRSNTITDLKLRASWGLTGNSNIGAFPYISSFAPVQYADVTALNLNNPGNSALRWEASEQLDFGIDLELWNRLNITADYYKKKTKDLILNNPILATIGFPNNSITENIGKLETEGVELSVGGDVLRKRNFTWTSNFNVAYNKNKVIATNSTGADITGGFGIARPGQELGTYFLIEWAGVNPDNGLPTWLDANGVRKQYDQSVTNAANRWTLVSNGAVTTALNTAGDRRVLSGKTPYPKFYGGWSNSFRFYNFDFSVDLQYAFDYYIYNSTRAALLTYTTQRNKSIDILNAWTTKGQETDIPKLFWNDAQQSQTSTRFLERGDFVRIRNFTAGYSFPKELLSKVKISRLRLYAEIQNAYTFTDYKGIDPEANANGNTNIGLGIDNNRPYLPRTFVFGLNLGL